MRTIEEFDGDIRAQIVILETNGTDEQVLRAARLLANAKDALKLYIPRYGLEQAPRLLAAIETMTDDDIENALATGWLQQNGRCGEPGSPEHRIGELICERAPAVRKQREEMFRPRTPRDLLLETLGQVEASTNWGERDFSIFLIGGFPELDINELLEGKPNLQKHLPANPCRSTNAALLRCSSERNREDLVGRVAELLIKMHG